MKEQLQRAKQALEAEAAPAQAGAADAAAAADAAPAPVAGKAQQRAKKADDYHARHRSWVAEFNELTGGECAGGAAGVKWAAVRAWQQKHWQLNNLLADGLVGPKTLEAAKLLAKKDAPKPEPDGAGDEKQKQAEPQPGHAEAAEASADKPNLDADADADEQVKPATEAAPRSKQATLAEFDAAATKLKDVLARFKTPKPEPGEKPIAQHYVEGTDDVEAPPALGAMMKSEALQGYEAAAEQLSSKSKWDDKPPAARAKVLLDAVNEALATEKVPAILGLQLMEMSNPGEFIARDWVMHMSEAIFTAPKPPNMAVVASQVFHEGRHAEQRFLVARLIASQMPHAPASKVAKAAGVLPEIAAKACELRSEPLAPEQHAKAEAFKHATVDNPAHKQIESAASAITDAANHAGALFHALAPRDQGQVSARWQELRQQAIAGLEAYFHLATERDAFAAQKQLADAIQ